MPTPDQYVVDRDLEAFERRPELQSHLGALAFKALAAKPFETLIVDLGTGRRELKAGVFLAAAVALSRRWKSLPARRVGVVFPSGIGSALTNLALALADKVPVNLNFTTGRAALEASISKAGITHVITAKPMVDRMPDFPWPEHVIDLLEVRGAIRKAEILGWLAYILALPSSLAMRLLQVPQRGGNREATLLFSSGSTGAPKGVVLTHRNLIGNCLQIETAGMLETGEVVMANLPTFHSFGCTVTLWYAMLAVIKTDRKSVV
jgi:acyl-[acyl-carrier-protein]-phospholipid O-acyltransferase/long-chain-fatty-acid--[acyl-carrier-protein] ligase